MTGVWLAETLEEGEDVSLYPRVNTYSDEQKPTHTQKLKLKEVVGTIRKLIQAALHGVERCKQ